MLLYAHMTSWLSDGTILLCMKQTTDLSHESIYNYHLTKQVLNIYYYHYSIIQLPTSMNYYDYINVL